MVENECKKGLIFDFFDVRVRGMKQKFLNLFMVAVGLIVGINGAENVLAEEVLLGKDSDEESGLVEGDDEEEIWKSPELYIKAVNPGYKIDGISNVGEMIEIGREESDELVSLAGVAVGYTNSSGNYSVIFEFPENSFLAGDSILLKLASSPEHELANALYTKTLAMSGSLTLLKNGTRIDEVCWTGKSGCYKAFNSAKRTVLVRDEETGKFEHLDIAEYEPEYLEENYKVEKKEEESLVTPGECSGVVFSEILTYYSDEASEQFIELHNYTSETKSLDGCMIRYKNKKHVLTGKIAAEEYFAYYPVDNGFKLTKNPTKSNVLELIDGNEKVVDKLEYKNGQKKTTALAMLGVDEKGEEIWKSTYTPTPGEANNYQEFRTCERGKVINEKTGNCVKVTSVAQKICKAGYYLNTATGRCKKKTVATQKTCKEGYYLNPETNRCKKIKENSGADYSLKPEEYEENSAFAAIWAVAGVAAVGIIYLGYEFRSEIGKRFKKLLRI